MTQPPWWMLVSCGSVLHPAGLVPPTSESPLTTIRRALFLLLPMVAMKRRMMRSLCCQTSSPIAVHPILPQQQLLATSARLVSSLFPLPLPPVERFVSPKMRMTSSPVRRGLVACGEAEETVWVMAM